MQSLVYLVRDSNVEQRKRLTIGVELAAKPQTVTLLGRAYLWS